MKKIGFILVCLLVLSGCKQSNYVDWKALNEAWLEHNKTQPGVVTTASGLQYKQLNPSPSPYDARPNYNSTVIVDYKLYLIGSYGGYNTGNIIEQSTDASFNLTQVVSGFAEGLQKMHVKDDFVLFVPADLGYGSTGSGTEGYFGFIPPYSTLIFEVHLKAMQ